MSAAIASALFRRWLYLLFVGLWRGERAFTAYSRSGQVVLIQSTRVSNRQPGLGSTVTKTFYSVLP